MSYAKSKFVQLTASTPSTVTLTGKNIVSVSVSGVDICCPIYFRADGTTASIHGENNYMSVGLGGGYQILIERCNSITVSLICEVAGWVYVTAVEA